MAPVGYFSTVARLQEWLLFKDYKGLNYMFLSFEYFVPS